MAEPHAEPHAPPRTHTAPDPGAAPDAGATPDAGARPGGRVSSPPAHEAAPRHQRARGRVRVAFARRLPAGHDAPDPDHAPGAPTRLTDLHQSGCLKLRVPRVHGPVPEAVLINTAGGLTGGDALEVGIELGAGAALMVATQTAERLYRSAGGEAAARVSLTVGAGARLAWLPQETIAFEGAALRRSLEVDLAPGARLVTVEPLVLGREAMGETLRRAWVADDRRVRVGGTLLHAESPRFDAAGGWGERLAGWDGRRAAASLLMVGPEAPALVERVRSMAGEDGAADAFDPPPGGGPPRLVARLLCTDGLALRRRLVPMLALVNAAAMGQTCPTEGHGASLPRVWTL